MQKIRANLYAFAFITSLKRTAGLTWATWLRIALFVLLFATLIAGWWWLLAVVATVMVGRYILFRRAQKNGYATFQPLAQPPDLDSIEILPPHKRVATKATGTFSAGDREHYVLLLSAHIWHVPIDIHAIMVERSPGSFIYQFIEPAYLESLRIGNFMFGSDKTPGVEVTFMTDWSPQISHAAIAYYVGGGESSVKRQRRTVYLAFESMEDALSVWKSLIVRSLKKPDTP